MFGFLLPLLQSFLFSLLVSVIAYAIMPKPKREKPEAARDLEAPLSQAGIPIPVVFGDIRITAVNIVAVFEKQTLTREVEP